MVQFILVIQGIQFVDGYQDCIYNQDDGLNSFGVGYGFQFIQDGVEFGK